MKKDIIRLTYRILSRDPGKHEEYQYRAQIRKFLRWKDLEPAKYGFEASDSGFFKSHSEAMFAVSEYKSRKLCNHWLEMHRGKNV